MLPVAACVSDFFASGFGEEETECSDVWDSVFEGWTSQIQDTTERRGGTEGQDFFENAGLMHSEKSKPE